MKIQGDEVVSPIGVAPTAMQKMAHMQGEAATAQGKETRYTLVKWFLNHPLVSQELRL